jgi:hypothetical protein
MVGNYRPNMNPENRLDSQDGQAIDGYHVSIDLSDVREMVRLLKNATTNINQIAKRVNETSNIYAGDIEDLRKQYDSLWGMANKILTGLAKIK